jgi:hypothetical protein
MEFKHMQFRQAPEKLKIPEDFVGISKSPNPCMLFQSNLPPSIGVDQLVETEKLTILLISYP